MDVTADFAAPAPNLNASGRAALLLQPRECGLADAVRALVVDAADAGGATPDAAIAAMALPSAVLWNRYLRFDAADPSWPDRDRFVLSAERSVGLLYALLHLTGVPGVSLDEVRCALRSPSETGTIALGHHPAVEAMGGPLGLGLATAVGMALAERLMAARFGRSLVDHRTWVIAASGDLMDGVSHEAISLAGHLRLDKLAVIYAEQPGDVVAAQACSTDQLRRFASHGWAVKQVDGTDAAQIAGAMSFAIRSKKPTFVACRMDEFPVGPDRCPALIPTSVSDRWHAAGRRSAGARRAWLKRLARHPLRPEFERVLAGRLPEGCHEALSAVKAGFAEARSLAPTRLAAQQIVDALAPAMPELIGASSLSGPDQGPARGMGLVGPGNFGGRYINFGVREHCMAAAANGIAAHGGLVFYAGAQLTASDHMRPALRLAAITGQHVIHVLAHDPALPGAEDPLNQPIEHLASMRAIPGLAVFRPADSVETAECWELALRRSDGPSLLVLTSRPVPVLRSETGENRCARGGYVLAEAEGPRQATLIATGAEVSAAMEARERLAEAGIAVAVVSLPCWELFAMQDPAVRAQVLGGVPRFGIEAASGFGWDRWLGEEGVFIGLAGSGDQWPEDAATRRDGPTGEAIAASVRKRLTRA